ncbi:hypothetical protein [uncultured Lacinutrix sp.]|uniref:hypothetical protein n=1 Tax=uncultured Lacinutrix sp. TaxID=574032 RepID=UPI002605EBD0|nr:hypothetical protein [uncultured Lacinutrix sp.]
MDNGMILITTFVLTIGIVSVFYYRINLRKKRHSDTIKSDWINFKKAIANKHLKGINKFGTNLIWNEHLTMEMLKEMSTGINNLGKDYTELKELKILIYNKYLDWKKEYPY